MYSNFLVPFKIFIFKEKSGSHIKIKIEDWGFMLMGYIDKSLHSSEPPINQLNSLGKKYIHS